MAGGGPPCPASPPPRLPVVEDYWTVMGVMMRLVRL
jgi:hypothetical protein